MFGTSRAQRRVGSALTLLLFGILTTLCAPVAAQQVSTSVDRGSPSEFLDVSVTASGLSVADGLAAAFTAASNTNVEDFITAQPALSYQSAATYLVDWRQPSSGTGAALRVKGAWLSKAPTDSVYTADSTATATLTGDATSTVLIEVPSSTASTSDSTATFYSDTVMGLDDQNPSLLYLSTYHGGTAQGELDVALNIKDKTAVWHLLNAFHSDYAYELQLTFTVATS